MSDTSNNTQPPKEEANAGGFNPARLILPAGGGRSVEAPAKKIELVAAAQVDAAPCAEDAATPPPLILHKPQAAPPAKAPARSISLVDTRKPPPTSPDAAVVTPTEEPRPARGPFKWRRLLWLLPLAAAGAAAAWLYQRQIMNAVRPAAPLPIHGESTLPAQDTPLAASSSWTKGALRLSIIASGTDGSEVALTNTFAISLNCARPAYALTTNASAPLLLQDLTVGDYALAVSAADFHPGKTQLIKITPRQVTRAAIVMRPVSGTVRFTCAEARRTFSVYLGETYLGTSKESYDLPLFVPHTFTLKAPGLRDATVVATLTSTREPLLADVPMERVQSGLKLSVMSVYGAAPTSGLLRINGSLPVRIPLPLTRDTLSYSGEVTLNLSIRGYDVINNDRLVRLTDRQSTNVVFRVVPVN